MSPLAPVPESLTARAPTVVGMRRAGGNRASIFLADFVDIESADASAAWGLVSGVMAVLSKNFRGVL